MSGDVFVWVDFFRLIQDFGKEQLGEVEDEFSLVPGKLEVPLDHGCGLFHENGSEVQDLLLYPGNHFLLPPVALFSALPRLSLFWSVEERRLDWRLGWHVFRYSRTFGLRLPLIQNEQKRMRKSSVHGSPSRPG